MYRKISLIAIVAVLALVTAVPAFAQEGFPHDKKIVYVKSQDLYFDTIVLGELPVEGPFQELEMAGPTGLQTDFGPGDPGYLGGRWWVDVNGNGEQDEGIDMFFLCPLLGPGRTSP